MEKRINIRASDYKFADKKKYYEGFITDRKVKKDGTKNMELVQLAASADDFTEADILARNEQIIESFIEYMADNDLKLED